MANAQRNADKAAFKLKAEDQKLADLFVFFLTGVWLLQLCYSHV